VLSNGARLVTLYEPDSPYVAIDVFFRVGVDDERGEAGITGLVTRAWFADARWRTAAELRSDLGAAGGGAGSLFGGDFAEIWSVGGASDGAVQRSAQTILLNLVAAPGFGPQAVQDAEDAQVRELAMERDNPLSRVLGTLRGRLWSVAPQGRALLGTPGTISAIGPADISAYYDRCFRPRRTVIVFAGRIRPERAQQIAEEYLGAAGWSEADRPADADRSPTPERVPDGLRDFVLPKAGPSYVFAVGYLAPGTQADRDDWPAMLVLDGVLGSGKAARLFRLRDSGALPGYEIRSLLVPYRLQSMWAAYVVGNGDLTTVRAALTAEIAALGSGQRPVTADELARVKALLKGQHAIGRQRLKDQSYGAGWSEVMGLGAQADAGCNAAIDAVTLDQVNRLAQRVFGANGAIVYTAP
jgi:predicted Zn-dependent peptidase